MRTGFESTLLGIELGTLEVKGEWSDRSANDVYTVKNHELLKTGLNNVVLPILFNVVNNIVQHC